MHRVRRSVVSAVAAAILFMLPLVPQSTAESPGEREIEGPEVLRERERWFKATRSGPDGRIPRNARNRALRQLDANIALGLLGSPEAIEGDRWVFIGPAPLHDGDATYSGRVTALATHPVNSAVAYVGTAQGGVWKTYDGGVSWIPLTDGEDSLAVGSLALAPSNPDVVYVGTGEGNTGCDSYFGAGILRSTDGGASWDLVGQDPFAGTSVGVLRVHPDDPNVVFAGNTSGSSGFSCVNGSGTYGLWKSTDGGDSWTLILRPDGSTWGVSDLVLTPGHPDVMFAGIWSDGVYGSTDGGDTWTRLGGGLPEDGIKRVDLAVDPADPQGVWAALGAKVNSRYLGTFRSNNGGVTWTQVPTASGSCHYWGLKDVCTYSSRDAGNCYWNLYIDVAPDGGVWLGGLGVWRSGDDGATWDDVCYSYVHVDQHAVAFGADGTVWIGNDGGVFTTFDDGASWTHRNEGLGTVQFYPGASLHPSDERFALAGTQDNGTLKYSGSVAWTQIGGGDGGFTAIDPVDPDHTWYISSQFLNIRKTTDGGESFQSATDGLEDANTSAAAFIAPYSMCPNDASTLVAGTLTVWRTEDGADWWDINAPDPLDASEYPAYAVAFADGDATCGTYFVGIRYNAVYRTIDGGVTWTSILDPPAWSPITDLAVDPFDNNTLYVAVGSHDGPHLLKTTNAFDPEPAWAEVDAGLPDTPANAVLLDPETPNVVYVGTDVGLFRSADGAATWSLFTEGLPNSAVFDLAADLSTRTVVAFTHGRGAYRLVSGGPGEASPASRYLTAERGPGEAVTVRYEAGCGATDQAIYWGAGPIAGQVSWSGAACGIGSTGIATFDPGPVSPGDFVYFVVVAQDSASEGSYGRDSAGTERPEAVGIAPCDRTQNLTGCQGTAGAP